MSKYNDYIINVGQDRNNLTPFESAYTKEAGIERAKELCAEYKCVEVVYMPCDDVDTNDIVWSKYQRKVNAKLADK